MQNFQRTAGSSNPQADRRRSLKEFKDHSPPSFNGKPDPEVVEQWLDSVKKKFDILEVSEEYRVDFATYLF